jgi:O-antigen/teichoic acid export membrane protein
MNLHRLLMQSLVWRGIYFITIFLLTIFLSRYLQAGGAGWIYYLTNWFSLLLLVGSLSMESAVTYYASNKNIDPHRLVWLSGVWTILVGVVIFVVISVYFGEIKNENAITKNQYIFFAVTYICGILLMNFFTALFYAQRNFFLPNLIMCFLNIFLIVVVLNADRFGLTVPEVINIYFLSFIVQGILLFVAYSFTNKSWQHFSFPNASENKLLFRYAFLALAANIVFFLVYRVDYWFVRHSPVSSKDGFDLGNYIQVSKVGQMLLIIPQIMASAVFPHTAAEIDRQHVRETLMMLSRGFVVLYMIIIIVTALTGKWIFPFVYGSTFDRMYLPMLFILPGIFGLTIMVLLAAYFGGKGNVKINIYGGLLSVAIVLIGNYFFTFQYGMIAAAIISSIAYLAYMFFLLGAFMKEYNLSIADFFIPRKTDFHFLKEKLKKISFSV